MVGLSDAPAHGSYTFTLIDTLDQHGAGEDTLPLSFQFTATDSDGDTTAPATITVGVIDDTPIAIGNIVAHFVEEEALAGGNQDFQPLGLEVAAVLANGGTLSDQVGGSLGILWGGDDSNKNVNGGFTRHPGRRRPLGGVRHRRRRRDMC